MAKREKNSCYRVFLFVVFFSSEKLVQSLLFVVFFVFVSEKLLQSFFVEQICSDMVFCRVWSGCAPSKRGWYPGEISWDTWVITYKWHTRVISYKWHTWYPGDIILHANDTPGWYHANGTPGIQVILSSMQMTQLWTTGEGVWGYQTSPQTRWKLVIKIIMITSLQSLFSLDASNPSHNMSRTQQDILVF